MMQKIILALSVCFTLCSPASAQFVTTAIPASLPASAITVGTTTISGGNTGRIEYNNSGVLGELTTSGSGTVVCLQTSCAMATPSIGVATGTSLALGGATIGANVIASSGFTVDATGNVTIGATTASEMITFAGDSSHYGAVYFQGWRNSAGASSVNVIMNNSGSTLVAIGTDQANGAIALGTTAGSSSGSNFTTIYAELTQAGNWTLGSAAQFGFTSTTGASGAADTILTRCAAACFRMGAADAASPVAQTSQVQNVVGGTSNTNAVNWTEIASLATGSGTPGDKIFQTGFQGISTTGTATFSNGSANITYTSSMAVNQALQFTSSGTLPTNFALLTTYYVVSNSGTVITVSATLGGSAIVAGSAGSGTQTLVTATIQQPAITALTLKGGRQGAIWGGAIPTVTGTGSPTIAAGSTNTAGEVTSGTSATSIVITFAGGAFTNAPFCVVTDQGPSLVSFTYTISTTAITITQTANSANKIDYICFQH